MTLDDLPVAVLEVELSGFLARAAPARDETGESALAGAAITAGNEQARSLLVPGRESLPADLAGALPEDQHPLVEMVLRQLLDTGQPVEAVLALRRQDDAAQGAGEARQVLFRASPVRGSGSALVALVVLPAQHADHERFVNVVSHDLMEPARMVVSFAELLEKQVRGGLDERAAKYLHYMVDGARRMQGMLGDMLALARVTTRGQALAPTDAGRALDAVLARLEPKIADCGAHVTRGELPRVLADEEQLQRVFSELLDNSLTFRAERPPRIHVDAAARGRAGVLSVADNGIGMEARYLEDVFTIFRRLHPRTEHSGHGTGLTIARAVVQRHGGRIWIESEPSRGTAVYFTLALA